MLPIQSTEIVVQKSKLEKAEEAKHCLPFSFVNRLQLFEKKDLTDDQKNSLRQRIIKEHASDKLNKKFTISFPDEFDRNYDPLLAETHEPKKLSSRFQNFCHSAIASAILMASFHSKKQRQQYDQIREKDAQILLDEDFATFRLSLEDGDRVKYDAILSGKIEDIIKGNFVFRLGGNNETYEMTHLGEAWNHHLARFATFQINGPRVGRSQSQPSYATMVKSAKMGLKFLETLADHYRERRETKGRIVLKGFSLGNGIFSELLRWHPLNRNEHDYLVYSVNTFSRLSDVPSGFFSQHVGISYLRNILEKVCSLGGRVIRWAKFDFDAVEAARLLSRLNIPQAILQASICDDEALKSVDDGVISANAALLNQIIKSKEMHKKILGSNVFYDKEALNASFFQKTEMTHCIENLRWSLFILSEFDELVAWAKKSSNHNERNPANV